MIYPETQHSRREIKDFLYVASKNPNKPTNRQLTPPQKGNKTPKLGLCFFCLFSFFLSIDIY